MNRIFTLFLLFHFSFAFSQRDTIVLQNSLKSVPLYDNAQYFIGDIDEKKSELVIWADADEFRKEKIPLTAKTAWLKFSLQNKSDQTEFYLDAEDLVSEMYVYSGSPSGKFVGKTGYNLRKKELSIPNDLQGVKLNIAPSETTTFFVKIPSHKNTLYINPLHLRSKEDYLENVYVRQKKMIGKDSRYILFFIGIHLCLFFLAMSRFRAKSFRTALLIFIFINLFYIFYYAVDYNLINTDWLIPNKILGNFGGALEPALYYVFFWSYIDRNKRFRWFVLASVLYWAAFYFLVNIEWRSETLVKLSLFIRKFGPVFDLLVTASVFFFLLKYKSTFYKYARLGVFVLVLSALQMSFVYILGLVGIRSSTPRFIDENSYFIMYIAIIIDFVLFLHGQNRNEIELQAEKENMEKQLLLNEFERQKDIQKERERISHDMHDDLGAGISAIKLQAEYLKMKISDDELRADVNDLLQISEEMNLSMREMLWTLNIKNDTYESFTEYARKYALNFLRKTSIKVHFKSEGILIDEIEGETKRNLFLCLKEILNNVYKHSGCENLYLNFQMCNEIFSITAADDGTGIPHEKTDGNGLKILQRRMQKIGGKAEISSSREGTEIILTLKI